MAGKNFMKRNDWIIAGAALFIALIWLFILQLGKRDGSRVEVYVDGKRTAVYSLAEDREVLITGAGGGTNLLVIESGSAFIKEASCPDQLCVYQQTASKADETIVCLPNKVLLQVSGGETGVYDAVTD